MRKKSFSFLVIVLLTFLCAGAWAGPREDNKAELEKMDKTKEFSKNTIIPLINCYAQNQPHLQFMDGDYPNKGREYISNMDLCTSKYPDTGNDAKLLQIKNKVLNLLITDIQVGKSYCDAWENFNRSREELSKKPNDEGIKAKIKESEKKIDSLKQDLFKHALEFKKIQQEFMDFNKDFNKRYVKARKKVIGR